MFALQRIFPFLGEDYRWGSLFIESLFSILETSLPVSLLKVYRRGLSRRDLPKASLRDLWNGWVVSENVFSVMRIAISSVCSYLFIHANTSSGRTLELPVQFVKGIGPKRSATLRERGISTVHDLLYYFPFDYIDLRNIEKIGNLRKHINSGTWLTVIGTVRTFDVIGRSPKQRFVIMLGDETGTIQLVFFRSVQYFKKAFEVGEMLAVSGKVTAFGKRPQFIHPSIDRLSGNEDDGGDVQGFLHTKGIVPKYGSSEEMKDVHLNLKGLRKIMRATVDEFCRISGRIVACHNITP